MTGPEIRSSIIEILSEINPDEDYENLNDDESFRDQLSMDSMDMLDIVLALRKKYKLQIPEEDYPHLVSMSSTLTYLEPLLQDR
ncbi:MAG: acyl carrier protein [Thermoguttaceae bacterium]|nr:acyl carrier protein [Thermoguttaceae bacterium]